MFAVGYVCFLYSGGRSVQVECLRDSLGRAPACRRFLSNTCVQTDSILGPIMPIMPRLPIFGVSRLHQFIRVLIFLAFAWISHAFSLSPTTEEIAQGLVMELLILHFRQPVLPGDAFLLVGKPWIDQFQLLIRSSSFEDLYIALSAINLCSRKRFHATRARDMKAA